MKNPQGQGGENEPANVQNDAKRGQMC